MRRYVKEVFTSFILRLILYSIYFFFPNFAMNSDSVIGEVVVGVWVIGDLVVGWSVAGLCVVGWSVGVFVVGDLVVGAPVESSLCTTKQRSSVVG